MWNKLIKIIYDSEQPVDTREHAKILLRQLDTAGGPEIMRHEIEIFLSNNYNYDR